ncbi:MAG: extracellular solute-binding protein, partial [Pikeienuella sp.]
MLHRTFIATALTGLALGAATSGTAARDLTVVSWGGTYQDAQNEIYFRPYAEKSGAPLLAESWDGGYGVLQAKVKAGAPNWDVVQVETEELELGCADGIYEPIDWEKLGGEDKFIDAGVHECGVGAIVWSVAIGYDGDRITGETPQSWADFWDVEKFPGKRGLRKSPKYALEFA